VLDDRNKVWAVQDPTGKVIGIRRFNANANALVGLNVIGVDDRDNFNISSHYVEEDHGHSLDDDLDKSIFMINHIRRFLNQVDDVSIFQNRIDFTIHVRPPGSYGDTIDQQITIDHYYLDDIFHLMITNNRTMYKNFICIGEANIDYSKKNLHILLINGFLIEEIIKSTEAKHQMYEMVKDTGEILSPILGYSDQNYASNNMIIPTIKMILDIPDHIEIQKKNTINELFSSLNVKFDTATGTRTVSYRNFSYGKSMGYIHKHEMKLVDTDIRDGVSIETIRTVIVG